MRREIAVCEDGSARRRFLSYTPVWQALASAST